MIRTSVPRTLTYKESGFSLVEILIVIGLIALITSLYITDFGGSLRMNISNGSRELAGIIRTTHDESILKGQVYRVAFDLDKNQYWVEVGDRNFLMRTEEQQKEENRRLERMSAEERAAAKDQFQLARSVTKKKLDLPKGVKFSEIKTARISDPVKGGIAYAYVFPHGFTERTIIYLKDSQDRENTLAVNSVTGKSKLYEHNEKDPE